MSAVFTAIATLALMSAVAVGQWIDRQCNGARMDGWRDKW